MPRPRMSIRVHLWATSLQANSLLYGTTDVLVGSEKPFTVSFFANRQDRYEARAQINRRHGKKYTSLYIFYQRVCRANTLLIRTTAVRGGTDTLRIFSSGRDAAGYIRSDVSAKLKLAAKSVQGCTLLARRRSRCIVYFKRRLPFDKNPLSNAHKRVDRCELTIKFDPAALFL